MKRYKKCEALFLDIEQLFQSDFFFSELHFNKDLLSLINLRIKFQ